MGTQESQLPCPVSLNEYFITPPSLSLICLEDVNIPWTGSSRSAHVNMSGPYGGMIKKKKKRKRQNKNRKPLYVRMLLQANHRLWSKSIGYGRLQSNFL